MSDKMTLQERFAYNLEALIKSRGISMAEAARRLNVPQATLSNWLAGKRFPKPEAVDALAEAFGVAPWRLFLTEAECREAGDGVPSHTCREPSLAEALDVVNEALGYSPPKKK